MELDLELCRLGLLDFVLVINLLPWFFFFFLDCPKARGESTPTLEQPSRSFK